MMQRGKKGFKASQGEISPQDSKTPVLKIGLRNFTEKRQGDIMMTPRREERQHRNFL